jgi:sirohydrochlorin cobaltochelatase
VALSKLYDEGVTHLAVQSLHTVPGVEYCWTFDQAMVHLHPRKGFLDVRVGGPLLMDDEDLLKVCEGLGSYIPAQRKADEAVVLVGHGTYHEGHKRYRDFEACAAGRDPLVFMGTLMGRPNCKDIIEALRAKSIKRVHLLPFMSVPGHHAQVDICGGKERSWKSRLLAAGFDVEAHCCGTLEHEPFRHVWLRHLEKAFHTLSIFDQSEESLEKETDHAHI